MLHQFWLPFIILVCLTVYLDLAYGMLRDMTNVSVHKPYSWARVQLAWWSLIVLSSFIAIFWRYKTAPSLNSSTVILLGISAVTTATARVIDVADIEKATSFRHQNEFGKNFFLDILSDQTGVSMHRFQTIVFNAVFGVYFINTVVGNLLAGKVDCTLFKSTPKFFEACNNVNHDFIMPLITDNNLILLGLSSATYAALKITENKTAGINEKREAATELEGDGSVG